MPRVVHFEIHAENPERARKFYTELFGWEFTSWGGPAEYYVIKTGPDDQRGINGGMIRRQGQAPIHGQAVNAYVCTVDVASVDDSLKRITALGGTIALPRMPIPGIGWLAYGRDTEGNIFGIMHPDKSAK